jgi:hypothetical protein
VDDDNNDDDDADDDDNEEAEIFQTNRSLATSIRQSGLNLAFSLGVVTHLEFISLSRQLGQTAASVVLHLDDREHLRHLFYKNEESAFGQNVTCFQEESEEVRERQLEEKAVQNTINFWDKVWTHRNIWGVPARAQFLQDVMARLERLAASSHTLPFSKCLRDLQNCIRLQHVVFFSTSENQIHSVKFFWLITFPPSWENKGVWH